MASYRPNEDRFSFPDWTPLIPIVSADFCQRVLSTRSGASKAGIQHMTRTLAMQWSQFGIRVNSVSPGLVNTVMTYWEHRLSCVCGSLF